MMIISQNSSFYFVLTGGLQDNTYNAASDSRPSVSYITKHSFEQICSVIAH